MVQPKSPPTSFRPGEERLAKIDAFAAARSLTRHAAILALIDAGLSGGGSAAAPAPAPEPKSPPPARQSFSHGRSKTVVVETKRRRVEAPAMSEPAKRLKGFDAVTGEPIYG